MAQGARTVGLGRGLEVERASYKKTHTLTPPPYVSSKIGEDKRNEEPSISTGFILKTMVRKAL